MIDHVILNPNEEIKLDTANNTVSIVLCGTGNIEIKNQNDVVFVYLQGWLEIFTLSIGTGVYTAKNLGSSACDLLIVREFIY